MNCDLSGEFRERLANYIVHTLFVLQFQYSDRKLDNEILLWIAALLNGNSQTALDEGADTSKCWHPCG